MLSVFTSAKEFSRVENFKMLDFHHAFLLLDRSWLALPPPKSGFRPESSPWNNPIHPLATTGAEQEWVGECAPSRRFISASSSSSHYNNSQPDIDELLSCLACSRHRIPVQRHTQGRCCGRKRGVTVRRLGPEEILECPQPSIISSIVSSFCASGFWWSKPPPSPNSDPPQAHSTICMRAREGGAAISRSPCLCGTHLDWAVTFGPNTGQAQISVPDP